MTIELFLYLFVAGSAASSLLTQALKKTMANLGGNIAALFSALFVGILGTLVYYSYNNIPYTALNITSAFMVALAIWVGSMCSYDKVLQLINQLKR